MRRRQGRSVDEEDWWRQRVVGVWSSGLGIKHGNGAKGPVSWTCASGKSNNVMNVRGKLVGYWSRVRCRARLILLKRATHASKRMEKEKSIETDDGYTLLPPSNPCPRY